jgi:hypothetical protein
MRETYGLRALKRDKDVKEIEVNKKYAYGKERKRKKEEWQERYEEG